MNVDEVARLFKPFQRIPRPDDNGGELGLGLTLASVIAERHQGSVSVVSSPMSGARVAVFLPL
jgi:signal transduction histidine kinase